MIWESSYWKEELLRRAREVRRRQGLKRWSECSSAALEKDVMLGFYAIRKLIEAPKLSGNIRDRQIDLEGYSWKGSAVTYMNWHKIDQKYDLDHPIKITSDVSWLANQFIHSFVFVPSMDANGALESILFNSDRSRHQYLYRLSLEKLINLYEEVATNDPGSIEMHFNEDRGNYDVVVGPTLEVD